MAIGFFSLIEGKNLAQRNPETLFLTHESIKNYESFKSSVPEKSHLVLKQSIDDFKKKDNLGKTAEDRFFFELDHLMKSCPDECELITSRVQNESQLKASPSDFLHLKGDHFLAAVIIADKEELLKNLLDLAFKNSYFNDSKLSHWAGISYTNYLLDFYSKSIQETLFPLMFVLGFFITFYFVKGFLESLILYLPCLFMAGLSLLTLKWLYGEMNMVTSIIPLINFTITLSLSFHVFFSMKEYQSLSKLIKQKWKPIFLMMFTTYIGFVSLITAEIKVISQFGLVASSLVLLATTLTYLWYWSFESIIIKSKNQGRVFHFQTLFKKSLTLPLIIFLIMTSIISVIVLPKQLALVTDATEYFPKDSKFKSDILDVNDTVVGMPLTEILISLPRELDYELIKKLELMENQIIEVNKSKSIHLLSNIQMIKNANSKYSNQESLPSNAPAFFALRSKLPFSLQESYPVEKDYRLTLLGNPKNVDQYKEDLKKTESILNFHNLKYQVSGLNHILMLSQESMIDILYKSFFSGFLVVFLSTVFYLKNGKLLIAFLIVSLVPIFSAFLFMYLMNYSLNIATVMTFSIALGLVGDSAFHIIHAKLNPFKSFHDYSLAVLTPVLISGLLLFICFASFMLNSFIPIKQFGGILSFIILTGMLLDLYVLPSLIYRSTHHEDAYNDHSLSKFNGNDCT